MRTEIVNGIETAAVLAVVATAVVAAAAYVFPPVRRFVWWLCRRIRRGWWWLRIVVTWRSTCRDTGLATSRRVDLGLGEYVQPIDVLSTPRLRRVRTTDCAVAITVKVRRGQTISELEDAAERLAAVYGAQSFRCWPDRRRPQSVLVVEFVMRDVLSADMVVRVRPLHGMGCEAVYPGRTQSGAVWRLQIRGRHTLVVGASGSGKGSVLWNVVGQLGPSVATDTVRMWGVDLKGGIELSVGASLFAEIATDPDSAVALLRQLAVVVDARATVMAGQSRLHEPVPGDPMHVLIVDELASLTAYADAKTRTEASRLLSTILSKGRAVGVVVVSFVQDPRKEVVGMRGMFTQTLALRLRSPEETTMVLGEGMAHKAPAHRINPDKPGTCWLVTDSGTVDRARAAWWPDDLIRATAETFGADAPRAHRR